MRRCGGAFIARASAARLARPDGRRAALLTCSLRARALAVAALAPAGRLALRSALLARCALAASAGLLCCGMPALGRFAAGRSRPPPPTPAGRGSLPSLQIPPVVGGSVVAGGARVLGGRGSRLTPRNRRAAPAGRAPAAPPCLGCCCRGCCPREGDHPPAPPVGGERTSRGGCRTLSRAVCLSLLLDHSAARAHLCLKSRATTKQAFCIIDDQIQQELQPQVFYPVLDRMSSKQKKSAV